MKIIVAVDQRNGMLFNKRRQSQDRKLREYILDYIGDAKLWMNSYSQKQFSDVNSEKIMVDECFLEKAQENDYCFIENTSIESYYNRITEVVLCQWNRDYPADTYLDISLEKAKIKSTYEFAGYSHDKITVTLYEINS